MEVLGRKHVGLCLVSHSIGGGVDKLFSSTLVDCYFLHFWYLERVCIGSVCEENDTEK